MNTASFSLSILTQLSPKVMTLYLALCSFNHSLASSRFLPVFQPLSQTCNYLFSRVKQITSFQACILVMGQQTQQQSIRLQLIQLHQKLQQAQEMDYLRFLLAMGALTTNHGHLISRHLIQLLGQIAAPNPF